MAKPSLKDMAFLKTIKRNIGAYFLHFLFVCILAPIATGVLFVVIEVISGARDISLLFTSSFITSLFAVVYGSIISVPLAVVSLIVFKWLMDKNENKITYFSFLGAFFGASTHGVFLYFGEGQGIEAFLIFIIVGMVTGYFLHAIWIENYTKSIAT